MRQLTLRRFRLTGLLRATILLAVAGAAMGVAMLPGAAAAATPEPCHRPWRSVSATFVLGDPTATYSTFGGTYAGAEGIAYKLTGEFPHSTTFTFSGYDDYDFIPGASGYVLNDLNIVPDPGSINPFQVGSPVNATPRNYTAYFWPDSIPIPEGLENVFKFTTTAADPTDQRVRFNATMRQYQMQPGFDALDSEPTVQAVDAHTLKPVACPASVAGPRSTASFLASFVAAVDRFGLAEFPVSKGNKLSFVRAPFQGVPAPESFASDGCVKYLGARLTVDKINVVTWHKVATYFNNQNLAPDAVMGNYEARYQSLVLLSFPTTEGQSVNNDNAVYQPDGSWVTVILPAKGTLTPGQEQAVRARAARLGYNVIAPPPLGLLPNGELVLAVRQKEPNPAFPFSISNVACWTDPNNPQTAGNDYRDFAKPKSNAWFELYASNPANMGDYYIDGITMSYGQFMGKTK